MNMKQNHILPQVRHLSWESTVFWKSRFIKLKFLTCSKFSSLSFTNFGGFVGWLQSDGFKIVWVSQFSFSWMVSNFGGFKGWIQIDRFLTSWFLTCSTSPFCSFDSNLDGFKGSIKIDWFYESSRWISPFLLLIEILDSTTLLL